jgi:NAD(P)-dependent dehydrogenase (short-subunit alcohol dehydrogenase family)/acyl dehydratase
MPDNDPAVLEHELRFGENDIALFAAASGDRNPLHLDPSFARATPFGCCVVHGALVAIGLLGSLSAEDLAHTRALALRFAGPVLPSRTYAVEVLPVSGEAREVRLIGRGQTLARALATSDPARSGRSLAPQSLLAEISQRAVCEDPVLSEPLAPVAHELAAGEYRCGRYLPSPELRQLARRWGAESLPAELLQGLAWASYAVGMQLPGLHSLLAGITVVSEKRATGDGEHSARYALRIRDYDDRTGQLVLDGALCGEAGNVLSVARIDCFWQRPAATSPRAPLPALGPADQDCGAVAVIGASRGFGAALSLELLGRGYSVHAAYSSSGAGAAELARHSGGQRDHLYLHRLDVREPSAVEALGDSLARQPPLAGIVLCAAPPPLPMGLTTNSALELADYVAESLRLVAVPLGALLPLVDAGGWVLFCSSSALQSPPRDWPHYVSAKAALEGLARWVSVSAPRARTVVLRPPAMRTDMTNTPSGRMAAISPEPVASWIVDRLVDGELPAGLSVLTPDARVGVPA